MRDSKLRRPERHCHSPTFLCSTALSVFLSLSISLFLSLLSVSLPLSIHPSFPTKRPRDVSLSRAHTRVRLYPPPQPVRTRRLLRVHQTSAFTRPHLPPHTLSTLSLSLSLSLSLLECYAQDSATSYSIHLCPSLLLFFLIRAKFARL